MMRLLIVGTLSFLALVPLPLKAQQQCPTYLGAEITPGVPTANQSFTLTYTTEPYPDSGTFTVSVSSSPGDGGPFYSGTLINGSGSVVIPPQSSGTLFTYATASLNDGCVVSPNEAEFYIEPVGGGSAASLQGTYTFLLQGSQTSGSTSTQLAAVGSFTADGQGNITSGVEDVNSTKGVTQQGRLTGTYVLNDTAGTLSFNTPAGPITASIFVPSSQLGGQVQSAALVTTGSNGFTASGFLRKQVAQTLPTLAGEYALELTGDAPTGIGTVAVGGLLELLTNGYTHLDEVVSLPSGSSTAQNITTTLSSPDSSTGRFTFRLPAVPATPQAPVNFVGYVVDASHLYIMSSDPHAGYYLVSGSAIR